MNQKTIILIVVLFTVIVVGMFLYASIKKTEIESLPTPVEEISIPYPNITIIEAKHYFIDGVHTLAGEVIMPTPCDLLEAEAVVMESYPEQVRVDFTVINNADFCTQVETAARFMVNATASDSAALTATFMGRPIELNLIPAAAGETPDEFEMYLKG
jgi:hypothetical protein